MLHPILFFLPLNLDTLLTMTFLNTFIITVLKNQTPLSEEFLRKTIPHSTLTKEITFKLIFRFKAQTLINLPSNSEQQSFNNGAFELISFQLLM